MVFDIESKHRSGLSQLQNITASEIDAVVRASSVFKGVAGAMIENVRAANVTLRVQSPRPHLSTLGSHDALPFLFNCEGYVAQAGITFDRLRISWGTSRGEWGGVQNATSTAPCVTLVESEPLL